MTKQEEIIRTPEQKKAHMGYLASLKREGIRDSVILTIGKTCPQLLCRDIVKLADAVLENEASQGVVIKVDRELPNPEVFEDALSDAWRKGGKKQGIDVSEEADKIKLFLKASGYVAAVPLIKEG